MSTLASANAEMCRYKVAMGTSGIVTVTVTVTKTVANGNGSRLDPDRTPASEVGRR
ncbi:MAG: hypothetical protein WBB44_07990 [Candidatus Nanopelagicales bacterium]